MTTYRELIAAGKPAFGTLITLDSTETIEALVLCGFDWLFIDLEHGALSLGAAQRLIAVVNRRACVLVRVPENAPVWIKRVMDLGCDGIIVPQVNSAVEAKAAVDAAKYPPAGRRSVGIGRAHDYGLNFAGYVKTANADTSVIVQIEHIDAVKHADEILAVEGVDGVQLGPFDLSGSMNLLGQVSDPRVQEQLRLARAACKAHRKPFGSFTLTIEGAQAEVAAGASLVAIGTDVLFMAKAAQQMLEKLRRGNRA